MFISFLREYLLIQIFLFRPMIYFIFFLKIKLLSLIDITLNKFHASSEMLIIKPISISLLYILLFA